MLKILKHFYQSVMLDHNFCGFVVITNKNSIAIAKHSRYEGLIPKKSYPISFFHKLVLIYMYVIRFIMPIVL